MSSQPPLYPLLSGDPPVVPPELMPDYDRIEVEDGAPVDGIYSERQMRLLTEPLYTSWAGPGDGRPFLAAANVGLFFKMYEPPIVPDVMLSLDVHGGDLREKRNRSYFIWEHGKPPEVALEIVSGRAGEELSAKRDVYLRIGVAYYLVWDHAGFLGEKRLYSWKRNGGAYVEGDAWLAQIGLGVTEWRGRFERYDAVWLRWCDEQGRALPTGVERAEQEKQRADRLAEKLRAMGVDPDAV